MENSGEVFLNNIRKYDDLVSLEDAQFAVKVALQQNNERISKQLTELEEEVLSGKYGTKNRSILLTRLAIIKDEKGK